MTELSLETKCRTKYAETPYAFHIDLDGRYGRLNYLNAQWQIQLLAIPFLLCGLLITSALSASFWQGFIFISGLLLPFTLLALRTVILRLHDLNYSGWWSLLLTAIFIPSIGFVIASLILLVLSLLPGNVGENSYGFPTKQGHFMGIILSIGSFSALVYLLGIIFGAGYFIVGV